MNHCVAMVSRAVDCFFGNTGKRDLSTYSQVRNIDNNVESKGSGVFSNIDSPMNDGLLHLAWAEGSKLRCLSQGT